MPLQILCGTDYIVTGCFLCMFAVLLSLPPTLRKTFMQLQLPMVTLIELSAWRGLVEQVTTL